MSKRHQSSRRRSYGRRQHELHERVDRGVLEPDDVGSASRSAERGDGQARFGFGRSTAGFAYVAAD